MIPISNPIIEQEELAAVIKVVESGFLVQGKKTEQLESAFAKECGADHAIAVNSGTAALHCALYALDIKQGDEVITTPFTFVASANSILMQNASPVFVDICEEDFNIDPSLIEAKITDKTKAILAVNLYGQVYNYPAVKKIAQKYNLKIIEDAAQSVGASLDNIKSGNFGDLGCFSLYATKNIMSGEGGMVVTNDEELAQKCRLFRQHGQINKYEYLGLGYNYRITDMASCIGIEQLKKLNRFTTQRVSNANKLSDGLSGIKGVILPNIKANCSHVFHQYTIRITPEFKASREEFIAFLEKEGIGYGIYYPKPLHFYPHFKKFGYKEFDLPVAEKIAKEVVSLPVHPSLTDQQLDFIINKIKDYAKN